MTWGISSQKSYQIPDHIALLRTVISYFILGQLFFVTGDYCYLFHNNLFNSCRTTEKDVATCKMCEMCKMAINAVLYKAPALKFVMFVCSFCPS